MTTLRPVLYVDMDNVLVDFASGISRLGDWEQDQYAGRLDEVPGIFALMDPMPGAVAAIQELSHIYDTYVLSTAPWRNPSAWQDKVQWLQRHFGPDEDSPLYKRLILTHHKNLNHGDYLVDDRTARGVDQFVGEHLHFGAGNRFPTWTDVLAYLMDRAPDTAHSPGPPIPSRHPELQGAALLECCERIATDAHRGQTDKAGNPYIEHPRRVAQRLADADHSDLVQAAGWLHDVVEDTPITIDGLRSQGIPEPVVAAVAALSRIDHEPPDTYYERVRANEIALPVKAADIDDNSDPSRLALLDPATANRLRAKYANARAKLGIAGAQA